MIRSFQIQKWPVGNVKGEMTMNQGDGVKKEDRKVKRDGRPRPEVGTDLDRVEGNMEEGMTGTEEMARCRKGGAETHRMRWELPVVKQERKNSPITASSRHHQAAAIHLLEHFTQDTSQSARKREGWTRDRACR
jgi:hypothetical protein